MQEKRMSAQEASIVTGYGINRDYGVGAQILHDLGLRRILLLSNHPPRVAALEGFGLEVIGHVPLGTPAAEKETADTRRLNATLRSDEETNA
jgi:3,4-dihydroxy 2-butanone 4-phosphate synthase/GTP cyclohydrolase II